MSSCFFRTRNWKESLEKAHSPQKLATQGHRNSETSLHRGQQRCAANSPAERRCGAQVPMEGTSARRALLRTPRTLCSSREGCGETCVSRPLKAHTAFCHLTCLCRKHDTTLCSRRQIFSAKQSPKRSSTGKVHVLTVSFSRPWSSDWTWPQGCRLQKMCR